MGLHPIYRSGGEPPEAEYSASLARYTVSMDARLLEQFDEMIARRGYSNRSEAIRDLIRVSLIEEQWTKAPESSMAATVTLVYEQNSTVPERLRELQNLYSDIILTTTGVHLANAHCLDVLVLRGRAELICQLAESLVTIRGVKHGKAVYSTDGENLY